jgi:hypothetical protein
MPTPSLPAIVLVFLASCSQTDTGSARQPALNLQNPHSPITLSSGSNDDVSIDGSYTVIDLVPDAGGSTMTGMDRTRFIDGDSVVLHNVDASVPIVMANESASSSSGNRFFFAVPADTVLRPRQSILIARNDNVGGWVVIQDGAVRDATPSSPSRSLGSTFIPSTTRVVSGHWSVRVVATLTIATGQAGRIELRSDAASPPTTVRARCAGGNTGTAVIGLASTVTTECELTYLVPAGDNVRLVTVDETSTPTYSLTATTEEAL